MPLQCADFGAWRLRKSWIGIGFERSDVPWGAMPVGKVLQLNLVAEASCDVG